MQITNKVLPAVKFFDLLRPMYAQNLITEVVLTVSILFVLNSFTKKRVIMKSIADKSALVSGHASKR